jgi:hypothetical protein
MADFIDKILAPNDRDPESEGNVGMVVGTRHATSADVDAYEAAYLADVHLPIPFYLDDGTLYHTDENVKELARIGLTVDQYKAIVENVITWDEVKQLRAAGCTNEEFRTLIEQMEMKS